MAGKPKAWITGAGGLIGRCLVQVAPEFASAYDVVPLARRDLDLTDFSAVQREFTRQKPDLVIHCAAMSKSPACQATPKLAWHVNVEATQKLSEVAAQIPFIFFSTDLVFDGKKGNYVESDAANPLSVYAETKVAAEEIVLRNPKHTVVRTSLNAGKSETGDRAFNEEMVSAWRAGKSLKLFVDEYRSPIAAEVTARAVWEIASQGATGIFHIAGSERLSRVEIGEALAALYPELKTDIEPSSLRDYKGAPRSPDTSLNCAKAQKLLSFPLPGFREWLRQHGRRALA